MNSVSPKSKARVTMSQRRRTVPLSQKRASKGSQARDDSGEDYSFTQPTSSQVQRGLERLTSAQLDQKMAEVVQFILIKDQKKIPIKRADIVKHVMKEYRNIYPEVIKGVTQTFEQVFGLKLVEIDTKNHMYILINKLEPVPADENSMDPGNPGNPRTGLLFVILSIIFMKGGVVKESVVWNTLKKLRVEPGGKHEVFGDVKRLITEEFVRQKNLEYVRIPHTDPPEHEFHWGMRAEKEVSKMKMLQFVSQLHDQEPQTWSQQYKEATADPNSQRPRNL
ncbi:non-structural maintenance of chromosomes element 3 homolog [Conger conger]|uniref:non-structural maintenance of chromosomes element 3 homolog n=1 Tax=Conger conger TaxID=82655 RepID=UPI002A59FFF2|nr:non-structural maintenance of chromosomes element 3 homolog [Conger conger]